MFLDRVLCSPGWTGPLYVREHVPPYLVLCDSGIQAHDVMNLKPRQAFYELRSPQPHHTLQIRQLSNERASSWTLVVRTGMAGSHRLLLFPSASPAPTAAQAEPWRPWPLASTLARSDSELLEAPRARPFPKLLLLLSRIVLDYRVRTTTSEHLGLTRGISPLYSLCMEL